MKFEQQNFQQEQHSNLGIVLIDGAKVHRFVTNVHAHVIGVDPPINETTHVLKYVYVSPKFPFCLTLKVLCNSHPMKKPTDLETCAIGIHTRQGGSFHHGLPILYQSTLLT